MICSDPGLAHVQLVYAPDTALEKDEDASKSKKALATILLLCANGPLMNIKDCKTAKAAWAKLEELYNPRGFTTEFLTLKEFFDTSLENFSSMEEYLHNILLVDDLEGKEVRLPKQMIFVLGAIPLQ